MIEGLFLSQWISGKVLRCVLPVNAIVVVRPVIELDLLKGDGAGEVAGDGRMKGEKGVQCCGTWEQKTEHQTALHLVWYLSSRTHQINHV